jgi:hypothetical protein
MNPSKDQQMRISMSPLRWNSKISSRLRRHIVNFGLMPLIRKYGKIEAKDSLRIRADEYSQRSGERRGPVMDSLFTVLELSRYFG